ncbi:polymorphic toxin-type HINT domain-containing protein [Parasulfitobacter algicola]|uniref:polymorphic toxin-type HINT domain-containing protein n=1 Tax=Parasulfitobacter algicola TaxID=2614809 RepID=UPI002483B64F|nr:polymorphic toxin-type HINT domain-containing protein [Sulfitobacter algicola]
MVAIETLREGDLIVARDEETGQSLISSVTAVMKRQATDVLWLTLEDGCGQVSRLGVTATKHKQMPRIRILLQNALGHSRLA